MEISYSYNAFSRFIYNCQRCFKYCCSHIKTRKMNEYQNLSSIKNTTSLLFFNKSTRVESLFTRRALLSDVPSEPDCLRCGDYHGTTYNTELNFILCRTVFPAHFVPLKKSNCPLASAAARRILFFPRVLKTVRTC